jgi:MFS family permease
MLADGRSRAWSIKVGTAIITVHLVLYAFADGLLSALVAECGFGIGIAFLSGADQAWLVDALKKRGEDDLVRPTFGRAAAAHAFGFGLGGFAGGFIGLVGFRWCWVAGAVVMAALFLFVVRNMNGEGEPEHRLSEKQALSESLKALSADRALIWTTSAILISCLVQPFNKYWQPFANLRLGLTNLAGIWVVIYGINFLAGWYAGRCRLPAGRETEAASISLCLTGIGLALPGLIYGIVWPISFIALHELGRGFFQPMISSFIQRRIESGYRATFGSLQSLIGHVGDGAVTVVMWLALVGQPSTGGTITALWLATGVLMTAVSLVLWRFRPK